MTTTSIAAELILRGGSLYEPGTTAPRRADLAIAGGRVIDAGDVSSTADAHTVIVDVTRRLVLPGFTDAHVHPGAAQLEDLQCNLVAGTDPAGYLAIIRGYADANLDADWLTGGGWVEEQFPATHRSRGSWTVQPAPDPRTCSTVTTTAPGSTPRRWPRLASPIPAPTRRTAGSAATMPAG